MRTFPRSSLIAILGALLLTGCADPQLAGIQPEQALPLSRQTTFDAAGSGQAGYFCRRAICAGDDSENQAVRGLLEFDLEALPAGQSQIASATLRLYQSESSSIYVELENLVVEHIRVANLLDTAAFSAPALAAFSNDAPGEGYLEIDVSNALKSALAEGRPSAQFRLRFNKPTNNNNQSDLVLFSTADDYAPQLVLRFSLP